ncbi:hypothetical protein PR001_g25469 [Phytophthora rubi]|uniref:Uncharacterized protein n=1 Tax=Phytophthora rubi TaxID=129364 RepID=A0A6A3I023_9STRA|nr:hypothetical protein PR001_g25469 [Phytophthora rubi]
MTRLNGDSSADGEFYVAALFATSEIENNTLKQSLEAFLPPRIAALSHVVERIDTLAMTPADRLVEVARKRDWGLLGVLAWDLRLDVLSVACAAKQETTETLHVIGSCFRGWCFVSALDKAQKLDTIKLLYSWIKEMRTKMDALPVILLIAATNGSFDILEFAFRTIAVEFLGVDDQCLSSRRRHRQPSRIAQVLRTYTHVQRWFHRAFYRAMQEEQEDIADKIYAAYPRYPACIKDKLFQTAARIGWTVVVEFIFSKGRINAGASERAFKGAADCRRCKVLTFLLKHADISAESVELAFTRAIRSRSIDVATLLLETKRTFPTLLNHLFESAIYLDIIQILFDKELISTKVVEVTFQKVLNACVMNACGDRAAVVKFLSDSGRVSRESIESAFVKAANANSYLIVNALCKNHLVSSDTVSRVFTDACANNRLKMVKILCRSGRISAPLAVMMFVNAIGNGHGSIVNFIWGQSWISHNKFTRAFINAAKLGDLNVVGWFCCHNRASREAIIMALHAAVDASHVCVAKRLLRRALQ